MTTLRQFTCDDLFRFNGINLDPLTEMYGLSFYLQYLARWPEYFMVAESPSGTLMGYIMGKSEVRAAAVCCVPCISRLCHLYFREQMRTGTGTSPPSPWGRSTGDSVESGNYLGYYY